MRARLYVLNGHTPVPTHDLLAWMAWFNSANRVVAFTTNRVGEVVSTVFLGWADDGVEGEPPWLFQTVVAGGPLEGVRMLYATWVEAVAGHQRMVTLVRGQKESERKASYARGEQDDILGLQIRKYAAIYLNPHPEVSHAPAHRRYSQRAIRQT
jgi:hypothetical protein